VEVATFLQLERIDRVLIVTLNRPQQMNALNGALIAELGRTVADAATDDGVHVVVITGAGSAFSAGADLKEALASASDAERFRASLLAWRDVFVSIEQCPKPVIAGINGITIAGGLELALSCDLMIASSVAKIGDGHISYGLVPGGGGSQRLPDAIGARQARWLMYTGTMVDAERALQIGLVQHVIGEESYREGLLEIASVMSRRSLPALAFMKRQTTAKAVTRDGLDLEIQAAVHVVMGADAREGLTAFTERRAPHFPAPAIG
jgi:enoyl-CoA hydratase